jgi:hypothetical protein
LRKVRLASVWLLAACGSAGCDGDTGTGVVIDGGAADGPGPGPGGEDGASAAGDAPAPELDASRDAASPRDVLAVADTRPAPSGQPLPPGLSPARRLFDAQASLTGEGQSSCSHQQPPSGDGHRWCAFARPAAGGSAYELWVIDVTTATTSAVPPCDGSSPGCLRLTSNLWTGFDFNGPIHPYSHEFAGDTLLFYADAASAKGEGYKGPVYAWRPGWARPRRISSDRALICWAHDRALLAHCVEDVRGDPMKPDTFELHAGPISDTDGLTLPSLGRVRPIRADGRPAWQTRFSPRGDFFAVSSPDPDRAVETLRVIATAELGQAMPREIIRDASEWQISNDGQRIFFMREEARDESALWVADFPSGANAAKIDSKVGTVITLGPAGQDLGVAYLAEPTRGQGVFRLLRDSRMPASASTLFTFDDMLEGLSLSDDLRYTVWDDADFRARVVRNADLRSCELNVNHDLPAYQPSFLGDGRLVFWNEDSGGDRDRRDGFLASPDGCQGRQRIAQAVYFIAPIADRGVILADEVDDQTQAATLKYAAITDGKWPAAGPVRVHEDVDGASVQFVGDKPLHVLFRVARGDPAREGTYVFGPVPF